MKIQRDEDIILRPVHLIAQLSSPSHDFSMKAM